MKKLDKIKALTNKSNIKADDVNWLIKEYESMRKKVGFCLFVLGVIACLLVFYLI